MTHSYGNHGGAVAYAGKTFDLPTTIVMPDDAPKVRLINVRLNKKMLQVTKPR